MTVFKLDPEVYKRYKDEVLKLCNSFQKIDQPGLSDKQIAERLGLDERTVTEIRCVAERDCYSLDEWEKAIEFKRKATLEWSALALKRPDLKSTDRAPVPAGRARRARLGRESEHPRRGKVCERPAGSAPGSGV
jgi:hypothetical protein